MGYDINSTFLNKQQKTIILPEYDLEFNTLNDCAKWFIDNQISHSVSTRQVAKSIRYSLNHSKIYQKIKIDEKEKVVYTYYE